MGIKFHVGQKVVCITNSWGHLSGAPIKTGQPLPEFRCVYTIAAIESDLLKSVHLMLTLSEFPGPMFLSSGFEPVVTRSTETGMGIIREILERESFKEPNRVPS